MHYVAALSPTLPLKTGTGSKCDSIILHGKYANKEDSIAQT